LICVKIALTRPSILAIKKPGRLSRMDIMFIRHWHEYDAFLVLLIGIALVEFIVWSI
jgi:hypothetical protein